MKRALKAKSKIQANASRILGSTSESKLDEYEILQVMGKGAFGRVYKVSEFLVYSELPF
jgi:hypothetical protein